jgi:hypothetical protein
MISLRLLTALNFDHCAECRLATINLLCDELRDGIIEVFRSSGDAIESLTLSAYGASLLPTPTLPDLPDAAA